jgi:hypothetical protein
MPVVQASSILRSKMTYGYLFKETREVSLGASNLELTLDPSSVAYGTQTRFHTLRFSARMVGLGSLSDGLVYGQLLNSWLADQKKIS